MFDKLKKLLEGGVAQVNPWDNGKTFQSVVNNRTPQQQNAVQQQQQQARVFNPARPQQAPQQNFTDKLRDILDANSQADKFRRAQESKPLDYRQEQQQVYGVKRPAMNVGSQLFGNAAGNAARFANTAGAALGEIQDTSAVYGANLADAVTGGNQTGAVLAEVDKRQKERYNPQRGIFGAGTWFDNQEDFRKTSADPVSLVVNKAAPAVVGTAFEAGSLGAGQVAPKLAVVGAKQFITQGAKAAGARAVEGVIADAASQKFERDRYSPEQSAVAAVTAAGLPIVARGAGKVVSRAIDAAGNAVGRKVLPRSVAEITQEVATARQPVIANNAPRTRVTPDGTILPPRPASEIAAELAASKARAADPNVQAKMASIKAAGQPSTPVKKINMTPDDQRILADFNDIANGVYKPDAKLQRKIELDATYIAEKYNIPLRSTPQEMAEEFDNVLQRGVTKPEFAPKPQQYNQLAPKPSKQDPLEALKAEARKYKSADEFIKAQQTKAGEYVGSHQAPTRGIDNYHAPASDVTGGAGMFPDDIYTDPKAYHYYGHGGDAKTIAMDKKSIELIKAIKDKPDAEVTMYRAVPKGEATDINKGDWVTLNKDYAQQHNTSQFDGKGVILEKKVKADELYTDGNSIHEFGYDPRQPNKQQLTDLYNQATKPPKAYYQNVPDSVFKQDPLEALKAEARKYKSADEYRKNLIYNDDIIIHQTGKSTADKIKSEGFKAGKETGLGEKRGEVYGMTAYDWNKHGKLTKDTYARDGSGVAEVAIDTKGLKIADRTKQKFTDEEYVKGIHKQIPEGYDGVKVGYGNGVNEVLLRPEVANARRFSITDLYNQAHSQPTPKVEATQPTVAPKSYTKPKTAFEQNTGVVAPTRAKATTPPGGGMPPAKAGASPAAPVPPRKPGKKGKTSTALNTNRMDLTPEQRAQLDPKVQAVVDTMSNEDVARVAKGAGLDTNTYSPGETRVKIAEQLNARQDVVRIMNEAEVARKAGNTERAAELLKQAAEQGRAVRSQGTDLGRQLQARKIIANELDTPQQRVFKLLDEAGVNPDVYAKRFAGVDFTDFKQVVDAYRELVPAKAGQWLDTVRYNSMLSSPLTQIVNIFGNAQGVLGVAPIEKTIKGGIDSIAGLFGKERQYAAGEGAAYLKGEAKAVGKAAKAFMNALRGVDDYANQDFTDYNIPLATQGAGGKVYNALSFPMRVLDGMDKFFRTLAAAGEDAALTKRTSKGIALRGDRQSLLEQEAAYRVFQADSHIPGQGAALNAMDSIADLVMSGRNNSNPIVRTLAKFTIPFVKTINNINKQGNFEYSPLGFLNLIGKEDKVEGITRAVMGTAVFGTSALMLKGGDMTWAEPRNAEERARFRAEGKQPYSVKIGGKWVGFSKLHPAVSFPMAMTAALDDAFNKGEIDQSFIDKTLTGFAKYGNFMSDQSYAKSVGDTLGAIGGDKEAIARAVSNQWQQLIPARALTGWIARMSDDVERKVDTTAGYFDQQVQSFMQQYPGLRQSTPTRDYKGEPIAANNPVLNAFSPVRVTDDRGVNPLDAEQDAIKAATEQPELLNKRQLKEIDDRTADKVREAQKQLISQPGWSDLTPEEKKSGLSRLESDIKAVEKLQYQAEKQVGQYSGSFTGKGTKLTANQKALINDGVKIGKYVGKSDSTEAKTNKEKYEQALEKFNDPDNGYSKVEKIKKTEELKRLTVQKDYDEDTTMLHGMSKEDVWGFLSTYEDGKAMADKLLALDDALTAAGVQDKNKFRDKYGNIAIKPKEKSSGKGGSKAKTVKGQAEAVSSERKLRALLANTNNKTSYRKPATQSAKVGLKKFAVKSAGITSRKGA